MVTEAHLAGPREIEDGTADSLTFGQLKKIVAQQRSKKQESKYAFEYTERDSLIHELEDWHTYGQANILSSSEMAYRRSYRKSWAKRGKAEKEAILDDLLARLASADSTIRADASNVLAYLCQGAYAESKSREHQIHLIIENSALLRSRGSFCSILAAFQDSLSGLDTTLTRRERSDYEDIVRNTSTILYFIFQSSRGDIHLGRAMRHVQDKCFISYLVKAIATFGDGQEEWSSRGISIRQLLLLLHQCLLCAFGGKRELLKCKVRQRRKISLPDESDKTAIVTTPLNYATFRSEIISKYPTYSPPPLGPGLQDMATDVENPPIQSEYLELPVFTDGHWSATPVPSPPPSPKGKKSMYTTDQTIPFTLPLGESVLSTIPQSIEEGVHLFQSRQRTSVCLTQLWQEQEHFVTSERGWNEALDSNSTTHHTNFQSDEDIILHKVDQLYAETLTDLQSFAGCLVALISSQSSNITPSAAQNQADKEIDLKVEDSVANTRGWLFNDKVSDNETSPREPLSPGKTARENEEFREMTITLKAVTGVLLLLLKWFRVSHVLKYEYLAHLLIDAEWIQVSHQALMALNPLVNVSSIREDATRSYFSVCASLSKNVDGDSDVLLDSASTAAMTSHRFISNPESSDKEPPVITKFDWKVFFVTINIARITQKLVKKKAHRNFLLVQAKSWLHLRRPLKIAHDYLQLCCLKLYKGQVPLCSRKWRMSNMKVITQIYMSCRPELREDWIAGTEADTDLEEAKHQEEAIRALVQFYNIRNFPVQCKEMGYCRKDDESDSEVEDFFETEVRRAASSVQYDGPVSLGEPYSIV